MAICLIAETLPVLLNPEFGTLLPGPHWFYLLIHRIFEVSNRPAAFSGVSCTWIRFEQPSLNNIRDSTDSSLVMPCCYPGVLLLWWRGVGGGRDAYSGVLGGNLRVQWACAPGRPHLQRLLSFVLLSFLPPTSTLLWLSETGRLEGSRAAISLPLSIGLLWNPSRLGSGERVSLESGPR